MRTRFTAKGEVLPSPRPAKNQICLIMLAIYVKGISTKKRGGVPTILSLEILCATIVIYNDIC